MGSQGGVVLNGLKPKRLETTSLMKNQDDVMTGNQTCDIHLWGGTAEPSAEPQLIQYLYAVHILIHRVHPHKFRAAPQLWDASFNVRSVNVPLVLKLSGLLHFSLIQTLFLPNVCRVFLLLYSLILNVASENNPLCHVFTVLSADFSLSCLLYFYSLFLI